ncbi:MAG: class I SAM-dependent methyltransferase [Candidatus Aminicenantes bacterium]|nr:class I SAM-dependent methyltransferase [Candidatus Aminicenantes bacterium]
MGKSEFEDIKDFWERTARKIKAYHDAPSTKIYLNQEKALIGEFFPHLKNLFFLKTDLWNEAKNTQILWWINARGAKAVGIDISNEVWREVKAKRPDSSWPLWLMLADARQLPFLNDTFDGIYSMGTVEHFPETEKALKEIYRVLKPQARAVIGVPNKHDLFLRPLQVFLLKCFGLYAFGYEKSFTRQAFSQMVKKQGFRIIAERSLLFMPGWLRLLDLFCYHHLPSLLPLIKLFFKPFVFLYERIGFFHRRGYLLVLVLEK